MHLKNVTKKAVDYYSDPLSSHARSGCGEARAGVAAAGRGPGRFRRGGRPGSRGELPRPGERLKARAPPRSPAAPRSTPEDPARPAPRQVPRTPTGGSRGGPGPRVTCAGDRGQRQAHALPLAARARRAQPHLAGTGPPGWEDGPLGLRHLPEGPGSGSGAQDRLSPAQSPARTTGPGRSARNPLHKSLSPDC